MKQRQIKNIDIIVKYFYPVAAGIETNILETHKPYVKQGISVTVHTSTDTLTEKNVLPQHDVVQGIKVIRYPYTKFGFFPKINWDTTDIVSMHNFNIFPHFQILLYVWKLKLMRQKNFIFSLTPHGGFNPEWRIFSKIQSTVKQFYHFVIGTFLINRSVDIVRAVSEWEHDQIVGKGVKKHLVRTIPNGVENEAYEDIDKKASKEIKKRVDSFGKYILQIGRIYMIKNYETTIKALVDLPKDVNYVIAGPVGSNSYKSKLEKLIQELGLEKRVIFAGVIRGIDKYYLIKHAQLMVHMALWESFCNVVHEGMSQGLVCIVADNTALPYLVKNEVNGYCLPDQDVKQLSEKLNNVLLNKHTKKIKDMEKRNREFGLRDSWKSVSDKLIATYRKEISKL